MRKGQKMLFLMALSFSMLGVLAASKAENKTSTQSIEKIKFEIKILEDNGRRMRFLFHDIQDDLQAFIKARGIVSLQLLMAQRDDNDRRISDLRLEQMMLASE